MGVITGVFGTHDANTYKQLLDVASRAEVAALMSDGHFGYVMPVGGVAAYDNKVSVVGVGFDIACGNAAIRTDVALPDLTGLTLEGIRSNPHAAQTNRVLNELADTINNAISFGVGRKNTAEDAPVDHPIFDRDPRWGAIPNDGQRGWTRDQLRVLARNQLGTVGSGNHYVDVFVDERNMLWVGVHFGSRGLGHKIATAFNAIAQGGRWGDRAQEVEVLLDLNSAEGHDYWQLMELAGHYAYIGREWVARKVVQILGGNELELVHNHHNFAWRERHAVPVAGSVHELQVTNTEEPFVVPIVTDPVLEARELVVVRKGATPAFPGQRGFVGGSMGDNSVILRGTDNAEAHRTLYSTVHGAGRVMSRTEAAGKRYRNGPKQGQLILDASGQPKNAGRISPQMQAQWLRQRGVILRGGGQDEAPQAYRRLPDVLATQGNTIEVLETLTPLIVCMAGANEHDPYKD